MSVKKKYQHREFKVEVFEIFAGEFGFSIRHELSPACTSELYNSITNGVKKMKTLKIAYEMSSFAASEINKFAVNFTTQPVYFQQIIKLTKDINNKLK